MEALTAPQTKKTAYKKKRHGFSCTTYSLIHVHLDYPTHLILPLLPSLTPTSPQLLSLVNHTTVNWEPAADRRLATPSVAEVVAVDFARSITPLVIMRRFRPSSPPVAL